MTKEELRAELEDLLGQVQTGVVSDEEMITRLMALGKTSAWKEHFHTVVLADGAFKQLLELRRAAFDAFLCQGHERWGE